MPTDSMWDVLDEYEKQESGGGGLIGKVEFAVGYKCYVTGASNEESFFGFDPMDEKAKAKALAAAKSFNEEHGGGSRPQVVVQFRMFRDDVIGREVGWKGDRFFAHPIWTPAYKEVVKLALQKAGVTKTGVYWARIGFVDDPSGRQDVKQDGNLGPAQVEHIVEVFKSKSDAEKAAASFTSGTETSEERKASGGNAPEGWEAETWAAIMPEITADIAKRLDGDKSPANTAKVLAAVAKDYGVSVADVKPLLA